MPVVQVEQSVPRVVPGPPPTESPWAENENNMIKIKAKVL